MSIREDFLRAVLGDAGATALEKAVARAPALEAALLPRAALAWVALAARVDFAGAVPGSPTLFRVAKNEQGYSGHLGDVTFTGEPVERVAARVAVALGCGGDARAVKGLHLRQLGESIDLLAKAQLVSELHKRVLDPSAGYQLSHTDDGKFLRVKAQLNGQVAGQATFVHQPQQLTPFTVGVEEPHQRKGLASAMYAHAEKMSGKRIVPDPKAQTDEGAALWSGNSQQQQFGKVEMPGQAAPPAPQGGPLEPTAPSRQQQAAPKPKLPKVPGAVKQAPKLRMSEQDLTCECSTCGGKNRVQGKLLVTCMCWRDLALDLKLEKSDPGYLVSFGGRWDEDARSAFVAEFRAQS